VLASPVVAARRPRPSFLLPATTLVCFLLASSAPTPLYRLYQDEFRFATSTLTAVYAAYPLSLLLTLITAGTRASRSPRRSVLAALALELVAMTLFLRAGHVLVLLLARILQGVATAIATSALATWVQTVAPRQAAAVNSLAPMIGIGGGALSASLVVALAPDPVVCIFLALLVAFAVALVQVARSQAGAGQPAVTDGNEPAAGPTVSQSRRRTETAGLILLLVTLWALVGFVLSMGPDLVSLLHGSASPVLGGFTVAVLGGTGAVAIVGSGHLRTLSSPLPWAAALSTGTALLTAAVAVHSLTLLLVATAVAGLGVGPSFRLVLDVMLRRHRPAQAGRVLTIAYAVSYLANSVPALAAGVAADRWGTVTASGWYAATLTMSGLASWGLLARARAADRGSELRRAGPVPGRSRCRGWRA